MPLMSEIHEVVCEMDAVASEAQARTGLVSWKKMREFVCRLSTITVGKALITQGSHAYLRDHHYITSTYIGLAKLAIMHGEPEKALAFLQKASSDIDASVMKNLPEHYAAIQELKSGQTEKEHDKSEVA